MIPNTVRCDQRPINSKFSRIPQYLLPQWYRKRRTKVQDYMNQCSILLVLECVGSFGVACFHWHRHMNNRTPKLLSLGCNIQCSREFGKTEDGELVEAEPKAGAPRIQLVMRCPYNRFLPTCRIDFRPCEGDHLGISKPWCYKIKHQVAEKQRWTLLFVVL